MTTKVFVIQFAPQLHVPGALTRHDTRTAQTVKRVGARRVLAADNIAHHFAERCIVVQGNKNSAQVIAVGAIVASRARRELKEWETALGHLMQSALGQER